MKQLLFNFFMEPTIGLISWQIGRAGHERSSGLKSAGGKPIHMQSLMGLRVGGPSGSYLF